MEANPLESVANNVLGTRNVADAAIAHGVERFVLISTDKALNPYSVYGQTKTLCEWIVGSHGERDDVPTKFVAVRFGNVLNSAGSVIPLFRRQIERGGPVTVTDPEMTRFFMTIPEAVALVIQAGAIGGRGRILVLDMGEPIRILDLARNMIRLSGKEPERDVPISFIGARPGEKVHEELFAEGETWKPTTHPKIVALDVSPVERAWLEGKLDELERLVEAGDTLELVGRLAAIVREPQGSRRPTRRAPRLPRRPPPSRSSSLRTGDAQEAELAAVALVGQRVGPSCADLLVDHERPGLDVHEERAGPKTLDASTMPLDSHAPRLPLVGVRVLVDAVLVRRLVHLRRDALRAGREVVLPDPGRRRRRVEVRRAGNVRADRELLARARILRDQEARRPSTRCCPAGGSRPAP